MTLENAIAASETFADWLPALEEDGDDWEPTMAVVNRLKIIHGYRLRQRVVAAQGTSNFDDSLRIFCDFMNTEAFYYD